MSSPGLAPCLHLTSSCWDSGRMVISARSSPTTHCSRWRYVPFPHVLLLYPDFGGSVCTITLSGLNLVPKPPPGLLLQDDRWILPIADSPKPPPERITFSLPVVRAAKKACFVACGEGKADMAQIILDTEPEEGTIPAALVKSDKGAPVKWILDTAGASKIAPR